MRKSLAEFWSLAAAFRSAPWSSGRRDHGLGAAGTADEADRKAADGR
jgi:hypothetical protein